MVLLLLLLAVERGEPSGLLLVLFALVVVVVLLLLKDPCTVERLIMMELGLLERGGDMVVVVRPRIRNRPDVTPPVSLRCCSGGCC